MLHRLGMKGFLQPQASGPAYLDSIVSSTVLDLDATIAASYPGSGTVWVNLAAAPADGSARAAYDFYTGDGATATTFPTFSGAAGNPDAYWSFDGGDYFTLKSGVNTGFLRSLHKTTGGPDFWVAATFNATDAVWNFQALFSTLLNTSSAGLMVQLTSSELARLLQTGGGTAIGASTAVMGAGNHILILSHSHGGNATRFWVDTATAETVSHTFNTTTTDASATARIGAYGDGTNIINSDKRLYSLAIGNEYLDNAKAAAIIAHLNARHGRTYA